VVTILALTETIPMENSVIEGQIISPAINDSTIEINESVKAPVEVVKEDVNKTVVAHHSRHDAPAQADVNKKSYTSIVSYYVPSLPLLLHLMS
jgi:hypothetical protein